MVKNPLLAECLMNGKIRKFTIAIWLYVYAPWNKITVYGCEFGQSAEWNFERSLDWHLK
jgi:1,4-alpha-glucan branching enzyme